MAAETETAEHGPRTQHTSGGGGGGGAVNSHTHHMDGNNRCTPTIPNMWYALSHLIGMFSGEVRIHPS